MTKPKRGDVNNDGLIFWGGGKWVTLDRFEDLRVKKNESAKAARARNPEKNRAYFREYQKRNPRKEQRKIIRARYKERLKERLTSEEIKAMNAEYYANNRVKRQAANQQYMDKNREKINKRARDLKFTNPEEHKARLKRRRDRKSSLTKMAEASRVRMRLALDRIGTSKIHRSCWYVGCSWEALAAHLEAQFSEGMSWDNHGLEGWHIDHIIPLASAKTYEGLIPLLHYTNLQPLWAKENLKKGDRV
jgi:hypothetical protein